MSEQLCFKMTRYWCDRFGGSRTFWDKLWYDHNVDGRFSLQGMRTGGPYKVTISYVGINLPFIPALPCNWERTTT